MKTIPIPVPEWANWRTIDADGELWIWELEPEPSFGGWQGGRSSEAIYLCKLPRPTDWTKELHKIEQI